MFYARLTSSIAFCSLEMEDEQVDSIETISHIDAAQQQRAMNDSDSDFDDFNYVINETERQLIKARLSLEKKRDQAQPVLSSIDRYQRKYVNENKSSFDRSSHCSSICFLFLRKKFYAHVKRTSNVSERSLIIFINLAIRV